MKILNVYILLILLSFSFQQKHIPKIQIYIESLCPDCYFFIIQSFKNFYENIKNPNLAEIELIPYGNAKEMYNTQSNKWEFTCQHGELECYGNLIETCAIQKMGRVNSYSTIICIESYIEEYNYDFDKTLDFCMDDKTILAEIKECVSSDEGNFYQHQMAQKTDENHYWVPWVLVDGVHDINIENKIIKSLTDYLCGEDKSKCYGD